MFRIFNAVDWSKGGAERFVLESIDFKKSSIGCCLRPDSEPADYPDSLLVVCL